MAALFIRDGTRNLLASEQALGYPGRGTRLLALVAEFIHQSVGCSQACIVSL